ncbi:aminotransferase class V-fold PLP-dependent enzyme [Natronobacterium gregoryi]|uniref:cysteine desulfurase n=2 Tax=Natronobacterium gregoryi TaxID=44930 RepID=L0AFP1_NATGS|nr:cysteine desulfurase [Natronobacterium gregoryi]AFZ72728.1 cysteine desulfurase-like protein, SufS subfamily [Natronobacterium gregoryi SP2]ELY69217.1 cysteine desulfurase [Natronobacterium gregoryi SP2]PLK18450.1 cysteine desulfurase [Natronobacterium gregoryi SP2]SFJ70897.1 cysteine desulfurase [Natronobacterium gregoryi]
MSQQELESLDVEAIREEFPILQREFDGQQVVYLDNAATTQTPDSVVDAMSDYYREYNANVHRGIHHLSQEASLAYEQAHDRVADFIGADGREEVVFTKNTTESENLVAYSWGLNELGPGDTIVLTEMEHHASLVTWQQIGERTGADVEYIRVDETGRLDMDHARELIDDDTAIVSAVHVSNTLGTVNPVGELTDLAHECDAFSFIDGAQAVPNRPVDVTEIGADFYAFSGHKMAGPTGIGVLYGKQELLEAMEPYLYGGGMIRKVTFEESTWGDLPWKFEPGTPPIAEAVGLHTAIDWLEEIGMDRIQAHEEEMARYAYDQLEAEDDVEIYGPEPGPDRGGLVSFNLADVHAHDLTSILNDYAVAVRAGDHCTQPLHDKLGVPASTRASFYVYNTREEVEQLVAALEDARELFA